MISPRDFTKEIVRNNLGPVIEVPCSYLKDFLNYIWESKEIKIENPVNEAVAMGLAAGNYLATGKIPIVAVQNSGFLITLNALTSLNKIYDIPVFYLITWRGEGGKGKDAPEHDITGEKLIKYLSTFEIPFEICDEKVFEKQIKKLSKIAKVTRQPVALIIKKGLFEKHENNIIKRRRYEINRFEAVKIIKNTAKSKAIFISSTGFPTRDSFNALDTPDFYMVGSMGHTFSIGVGVAENTRKKVIVMEGDGSAFMHLGGLSSFNEKKHKNLIYIILDNESYESTGGQKNTFSPIDLLKIAKEFGFKNNFKIVSGEDLEKALNKALKLKKPSFILVKINTGGEAGGRVSDKYTCPEIKERFMRIIK